MNQKLSLVDLPLKNKRVLIRVDFNVPLDKEGNITDDTRIRESLPSIKYVLEQGGAVVLMSHLGRPKSKRIPEYSLAPCANRLSQLLGRPVIMAKDCVGTEVEEQSKNLQPGQVLLLENLRFHRGEEHPEEDSLFAQQLARLGDMYVNDAFGTAHRAHSSTAEIAKYFPRVSVTGFLMEKEIQFLGTTLLNPKRPFYAIIGGAKISTKFGVIKALMKKADAILIGGGMAYTFLKAQGISIGDSIHEDDCLAQAKQILSESREGGVKFLLPLDFVAANMLDEKADTRIVESHQGIPEGFQGVDVGPKTVQLYSTELKKAETIFWNGPLGVFEIKAFAKGTNAIAKAIANLPAIKVVGGGDSVAALQAAQLTDKITHISTGGGASLEFIEFGQLPGIQALSDTLRD